MAPDQSRHAPQQRHQRQQQRTEGARPDGIECLARLRTRRAHVIFQNDPAGGGAETIAQGLRQRGPIAPGRRRALHIQCAHRGLP